MKKVISTTNAPAAIGPYSQAIEANGFVFASGQIPVNPATGEVAEGIEGQAEQVMKNMKNLLEAAGTSMENVVKNNRIHPEHGRFCNYQRNLFQIF